MMKMDGKHLGKTVEFRFIAGGLIRGKLLKIGTIAALGHVGGETYTVEVGATKYKISSTARDLVAAVVDGETYSAL